MKRMALVVPVVAILFAFGAARAEAQGITFGVGGGLTMPSGDFNTAAKMGWHGLGHIGFSTPAGVGFRGDFFYGENKFDGISGKAKLAGGLGNITYAFGSAPGIKPYVIGGIGFFNVKFGGTGGGVSFSGSESKFAFGGGAGLKFKAGSDSNFFVEGRYISVQTSGSSTGFIPITAGISFGM